MSFRFGPIGPRAISLLAAVGVIGLLLAAHGWAHRAASSAVGSLAAGSTTGQHAGGAASPAASSPASANSGATAGPPSQSGAAATAPGPLLKSQAYAPYAFLVWPGSPSSTAKAAMTGLAVSVRKEATGVSISATVNGQSAGPAHFYAKGARVYIVEASMGDDSGNSDYSLGDDGLVVTDSQGRIVT